MDASRWMDLNEEREEDRAGGSGGEREAFENSRGERGEGLEVGKEEGLGMGALGARGEEKEMTSEETYRVEVWAVRGAPCDVSSRELGEVGERQQQRLLERTDRV